MGLQQDELLDQLFCAFLSLRTRDECYRFFEDLCTVGELKSLAQRLEVARMLRQGATYLQIERDTGASTATISRVKRSLQYGANGYHLLLDRLTPPTATIDGPASETRWEKPDTLPSL